MRSCLFQPELSLVLTFEHIGLVPCVLVLGTFLIYSHTGYSNNSCNNSNNVADPVCAWLMSTESGKWVYN